MKRAKKPAKYTRIPPDVFVKLWQASASVADLAKRAEALGHPLGQRHALSARATQFRKKGVPLKNMPRYQGRGRQANDWQALAALAREHAPRDIEKE